MVSRWSIVFVSWRSVTDKLWSWLVNSKDLETLVIFNYDGSRSLNPILKLHLRSLYISGESNPGKTFIKKMHRKTSAMAWDLVQTRQRITHEDIDKMMNHIELEYISVNRIAALTRINESIVIN